MTTSPPDYAIDLIRRAESLSLTAYQDSAGVWTIGWGHTGGVKAGDEITAERAEELLREDIEIAAQGVRSRLKVAVTEYQFWALVSFAFNLGSGRLGTSTLLRLLNEGDDEGAANEFQKWRKGGGQVLSGLVKRRGWEEQLFRTVGIIRPR